MAATAKHPESAPRCLSCGYNLYGLDELRCPECGRRIESMEELEQARWLAPRNEEDRRWLRRRRLGSIFGAGLLLIGVSLSFAAILDHPGPMSCAFLVCFAAGVSWTIVILFLCYSAKESDSRSLHVAGWVWMAAGVVLWLWLLW